MCYGNAVICHRHSLTFGLLYTGKDVPAVEHAGPAVDDEIVSGQILREVTPGNHIDPQPLACPRAQHAGKLNPADVL